jgi:hypothetical protein
MCRHCDPGQRCDPLGNALTLDLQSHDDAYVTA